MKTLLLLSSLTLACTPAFAASNSSSNIAEADKAANTLNIDKLQQLSTVTQDYEAAYANYRLAISANVMGQKTMAENALASAQASLETLTNSQADAESLALLSSVYGMQIALDNSKGAALGIKSANAIAQAEQLAPLNPRVTLVKAIAAYNTPAMFGGSMQVAKTLASSAIERFRPKLTLGADWPNKNWGISKARWKIGNRHCKWKKIMVGLSFYFRKISK